MPDVQSCSRTLSTTPRQTTWNRRQCKVVCTPELNEVLTLSFRFLRVCACTYIFFFLCVYAWLHSVQFNPQLLDLHAQVVRFVLQGNFAIPICSVHISRQKNLDRYFISDSQGHSRWRLPIFGTSRICYPR